MTDSQCRDIDEIGEKTQESQFLMGYRSKGNMAKRWLTLIKNVASLRPEIHEQEAMNPLRCFY